jgi:hypothetical protein
MARTAPQVPRAAEKKDKLQLRWKGDVDFADPRGFVLPVSGGGNGTHAAATTLGATAGLR